MIIQPALGIGDLLTIKLYCLENNISIDEIKISIPLLNQYKLHPEQNIKFLEKFIKNLLKIYLIYKYRYIIN